MIYIGKEGSKSTVHVDLGCTVAHNIMFHGGSKRNGDTVSEDTYAWWFGIHPKDFVKASTFFKGNNNNIIL